jgi:hypothetical protein
MKVSFLYLAKVDTKGRALKLSVVKTGLGLLGVKGGVINDKDTIEGLDGCKIVDLTKGLCLGLKFEHGFLFKVYGLQVGDREGVCGNSGGDCLWHDSESECVTDGLQKRMGRGDYNEGESRDRMLLSF